MDFLKQHPLIKFCISFIAGIILADNCSVDISLYSYIIIIVFIVFILLLTKRVSFRYRNLFGIFTCFLLTIIGFANYHLSNESFSDQHFSTYISSQNIYVANIAEIPEEREKSVKIIATIESVKVDSCWKKTSGKLLCYFQKDSAAKTLEYGDKIIINTSAKKIEPPKNPYEFNYKRYLSLKNIFHQGYLHKNEWELISHNKHCNSIKKTGIMLRNKCLAFIQDKHFSKNEYAVAAAILLGDGENIDKELRQAYQSVGVMHILCVSGLHVGLFAMVLQQLLFFMKKQKWQIILRSVIVISSIWIYALLTGLSPSVMRSAVMFTFVSIGQNSNRNTDIYNSLASSALLLLAIHPQMLYSVGFQLSYIAVIGIAALQKHIKQWWNPQNKILSYCWELTAVSIAAQLATSPLSVYYFHLFPNYFILSNLVASPLSVLIIPLGILTIVSSFIFVPFAKLAAYCLEIVIKIMNKSILIIEQLPCSTLNNIHLSLLENILLYVFIILLCNALIKHKKKLFLCGLAILLILLTSFNCSKIKQLQQNFAIVYHIPKHSAIEFINGQNAIIITDSFLLNNQKLLEFPTQNFIIQSGIKKRMIVSFNDSIVSPYKNFINFNGYCIAIINKTNAKNKYCQKIKVDCLLLQNNPNVTLKGLLDYYDTKLIIADGSNTIYSIARWSDEPRPENICFHHETSHLLTIR